MVTEVPPAIDPEAGEMEVMLGGAGRAFGCDYWIVPRVKRWWNGTKFARNWHFYGDDPTK
jgi:hypothetical protein